MSEDASQYQAPSADQARAKAKQVLYGTIPAGTPAAGLLSGEQLAYGPEYIRTRLPEWKKSWLFGPSAQCQALIDLLAAYDAQAASIAALEAEVARLSGVEAQAEWAGMRVAELEGALLAISRHTGGLAKKSMMLSPAPTTAPGPVEAGQGEGKEVGRG